MEQLNGGIMIKMKILSEMEGIVNVLDEIEEDTVRMIDN